MLNPKIKTYIDKIESENTIIEEYEIASNINNIFKEDPSYSLTTEDIAEAIGFDLTPEYSQDSIASWGLYYGPKMVWEGKESPGRSFITEEVIQYWKTRSLETKNLVLKIRYADLAYEFTRNKSLDKDCADIILSATVELSKNVSLEPLNGIVKLKRALNVARSFKDHLSIKIDQLAEATANFEKRTAEDNSPGLWGYTFEWFVTDYKDQQCSDSLKTELLKDLTDRIRRLSSAENINVWAVERGVSELLDFYGKNGNSEAIKNLILTLEKAYKEDVHSNSSGMLIINYLKKIHNLYFQYKKHIGDSEFRRIELEIQEKSGKVLEDMKEVSFSITITDEEMERFKIGIFGEPGKEKKIEEVIKKIFLNFISRIEHTKQSIDDLSKSSPLQFLFTEQLINHEGVTTAVVGGLEDDYERRLYSHGTKLVQYNSVLLRVAMNEFFNKFKNSEILRELFKSKLFDKNDKSYLKRILKHYRSRNYLEMNSLTIPYIESLIREFARYYGASVLKKNNEGGFDYCGLETLFKNDFIQKTFGLLGEDVFYHLKLVLTSSLGLNLRNVFCHGINKEAFYFQDNADKLLFILFTLSLVRIKSLKSLHK